jgi:hypothetical protein
MRPDSPSFRLDDAAANRPLELIVCEPSGPIEPQPDPATRLHLLWARIVAGGLTDRHVRCLTLAGCLEPTGMPPNAFGRPLETSRTLNDRQLQMGLLLTRFGRAILPAYLPDVKEPATTDIGFVQVAGALLQMAERPIWNAARGELWWQGTLVKRFRHDAADQRCLLDAFQAGAWMKCEENPLPHRSAINRKTQLQNTIKDLNRGQHPLQIKFRGNGRGGARWEALHEYL